MEKNIHFTHNRDSNTQSSCWCRKITFLIEKTLKYINRISIDNSLTPGSDQLFSYRYHWFLCLHFLNSQKAINNSQLSDACTNDSIHSTRYGFRVKRLSVHHSPSAVWTKLAQLGLRAQRKREEKRENRQQVIANNQYIMIGSANSDANMSVRGQGSARACVLCVCVRLGGKNSLNGVGENMALGESGVTHQGN